MPNPLFYRNYPPNVSYNPYLNSSYQRPSPFERIPVRPQQPPIVDEASIREQARQMAERKARRAQYLPDEEEEQDFDDSYGGPVPRPRRRQPMQERQRQEALERKQMTMERQKQLQQIAAAEETRRRDWQRQARSESPVTAHAEAQEMEDKSVPIQYRRSPTPEQQQERNPEPQAEPKPIYTEEHNQAASRIQQTYRIHKSFQTLDELEKQFHALKKDFVYPTVIDFQKPGSEKGVLSVAATYQPSDFSEPQEDGESMDVDRPQGKLAYTSTNYGLLSYFDAMDKLLIKLDGVESFGEESLRQRRRGIVKEIERESRRLSWCLEEAWRRHIEKEVEEAGWDFVDSDK